MKTNFNRSSILTEQWFNAIQRLKFVPNPIADGEYSLLCDCDLDLPSVDAELVTVGTEQQLSVNRLIDCEVVSTGQPDDAVPTVDMVTAVTNSPRTTLKTGQGLVSNGGTIGLAPAVVNASSILLGDGLAIYYGEILANNRGGGDLIFRVNFPQPFNNRPSLLRLDCKYVNSVANRYAVIDAGLQTTLIGLTNTTASIKSFFDQGGGGRPNEFSVYYAFLGIV
jgi:hypothetical protein